MTKSITHVIGIPDRKGRGDWAILEEILVRRDIKPHVPKVLWTPRKINLQPGPYSKVPESQR